MRKLRPLALVLIPFVARPALPQAPPATPHQSRHHQMTNLNPDDTSSSPKLQRHRCRRLEIRHLRRRPQSPQSRQRSDAVIKVMINPAPPPAGRHNTAPMTSTRIFRLPKSASTGKTAPPSSSSKAPPSHAPKPADAPPASPPTAFAASTGTQSSKAPPRKIM